MEGGAWLPQWCQVEDGTFAVFSFWSQPERSRKRHIQLFCWNELRGGMTISGDWFSNSN
jgi:hypothetical protein